MKGYQKDVKITLQSIEKGHHEVTYRGIPAVRCPFDYVMYQMIISEVKPDLIIEIGTFMGGGALYLADLLNTMGKGMVHTIDMQKMSDDAIWNNSRIKCFTDGWENYDLKQTEKYETVLVIEDSAHTYENTIGVMKKFGPVVSKNSYFIIEDGIISDLWEYHGGPLKAIREYMKDNKDYVIDRKWCDFFGTNATFNPNGYLMRVN
jgi:cephalosporin hydroxylase